MAIPALNESAFLPPGVYVCSLEELQERFGRFHQSTRRLDLVTRFRDLVKELRASRMFRAIVIDGSFVTGKPDPADIDLILVLPPMHEWNRDATPDEYNLLSRSRLRRRFGFDVLLAADGDLAYEGYVEFFGRVRTDPLARKGMLRIEL